MCEYAVYVLGEAWRFLCKPLCVILPCPPLPSIMNILTLPLLTCLLTALCMYMHAGLIKRQEGDILASLELFQKAVKLNKNNSAAVKQVARSLYVCIAHPLTHSLTHPLSHSLTHSLTHSPTQSFTHSLTHSLPQSFTDQLTHYIFQVSSREAYGCTGHVY